MRAGLTLGLFVALSVFVRLSSAQSSRQGCIDAFERAQRERKDGAFKKAENDFRICTDAACPAMVRKDCTDGLAAVAGKMPSVRVSVENADGTEIEDFDLEIDGESQKHGDKPIELDPGEHVVNVELEDGTRHEQKVTLRPGDQSVPVVVKLGAPSGPEERHPEPEAHPAKTPAMVYVLGGVAVVGLAGFTGFGLAGKSAEGCKGHCSEDEISTIHRDFLLADIGLAVALVSGGAAAYFYVSRPKSEAQPSARLFLTARPIPRGSMLSTGVSF